MGLLKHLLFWPVTGPLSLIDFSLGKVDGVVRQELTDDTAVKAELLELQLALELGDITDDQYVQREAALMYRLREIRDWREQFGMGVSGGPVRVSGAESEEQPPPEQKGEPSPDQASQIARPTDATIELNFDDR
jgi:Gas vesicle protein G